MHIVTANVNGIRSAASKGFLDWVKQTKPDVLCLQEIKADKDAAAGALAELSGMYHQVLNPAEKKGYSGVAVLMLQQPDAVSLGIGNQEYDAEGRVIVTDYQGVRIINSYFPSGTTGDVRQTIKEAYLKRFTEFAAEQSAGGKQLVVVGDFNIAHTPVDIHNPKLNNVSGVLPQERAWFTEFLSGGYTDSFRHLYPEERKYSWWTFRANARAKNLGWRLDYALVSDNLKDSIGSHVIHDDLFFSDHCPVSLKLK